MAYSVQLDLQNACGGIDRLTQLTDWNKDRSPDVDVIASAIADADALINSLINKQYLVPLQAPIPQEIVNVSARIAKYRLLSSRGMLDDGVMREHEADVKWLEGVRDGVNTLGVEPVPVAASMRIDAVSTRPIGKDVSRAKLKGFS